MNKPINVAILAGGFTAEFGISMQSALVVLEHLDKEKYNSYVVVVTKDQWTVDPYDLPIDKNDFSFILNGDRVKFDAAFMAIHGTPGEDGHLQGYLDMLSIPYNCSDVMTASLTFNKQKTKEYLSGLGCDMAKSLVVNKGELINEVGTDIGKKFKFPIFIKPNRNGSSYGISKLSDDKDISDALENGFKYDEQLIVEEFIEGIEVTCGLLKTEEGIQVLPLTEIVCEHDFFNFEAKYTPGEAEEITPARISEALTSRCKELSVRIYEHLNCKGIVRIDYILNNDQFYLLEVNTVPGLSINSIVPRQVQTAGLSLTQFFNLSMETCLQGYK